ncbi:MAG TPA: HAMP domain-containing sensor histidine kinase [Candidatus Saccharimonadales bacterium]
MDHLHKFTAQLQNRIAVLLMANSITIIGGYWIVSRYIDPEKYFKSQLTGTAIILVFVAFLSIIILAWIASKWLTKPIKLIWQAVLHISPETANLPAPDMRHIGYGKELVTTLVSHVYQLASVVDTIEKTAKAKPHDLTTDFVANSLPMPLLVLDKDANIVFANGLLLKTLGRMQADTFGQNVYSVLDLSFTSKDTLDSWLEQVKKDQVTATRIWERVRLNVALQEKTRYFDLIAYYNKNNPEGFEIMLVLFERTEQYGQDDQALSFVALAVHELRTPLTLLRGYIDVFEEELDGKLDPEMTDFMRKMKAAAQQLAAFTTNVLNVARFENDQLVLTLHEEKLEPIIKMAVNNMQLRAKVNGVALTTKIDANLPSVSADAVSISEVINNLLDNAIKYSKGEHKEVIIHAHQNSDGSIETTVQDFGPGVPESAVSNLFTKFYRDYRNREHVGGTGMGLYLSKAIIDAHGGNIWVRSREGQGATFGFTLNPYGQVADEQKTGDNDITRTAHGWIKNHSLYRR